MKPALRLRDRLTSVGHALRGLATLVRTQHNAWLHLAATVLVVIAGAGFGVTPGEWLWLILAITLVWAAEAFNTALEFLADAVSRERQPLIGQAKDVAAAAVLIAAIGAALIGVLVLGPHALRLLGA